MSLTHNEPLSFSNLGCGAAKEQFDDALAEVLENIQDPNTEAKSVREIVLKVRIAPDERRLEAAIDISVVKKLAPTKPYPSRIFIGKSVGGRPEAREVNANQADLFPARRDNVTGIDAAKGGE
jgi:hypothetical protein